MIMYSFIVAVQNWSCAEGNAMQIHQHPIVQETKSDESSLELKFRNACKKSGNKSKGLCYVMSCFQGHQLILAQGQPNNFES